MWQLDVTPAVFAGLGLAVAAVLLLAGAGRRRPGLRRLGGIVAALVLVAVGAALVAFGLRWHWSVAALGAAVGGLALFVVLDGLLLLYQARGAQRGLAVVLAAAAIAVVALGGVGQHGGWERYAQAQAAIEAKDFAGAEAILADLVADEPGFTDAHAALGHARVGLGAYDGAKAAYGEAIARDPEHTGAHVGRGWMRWFTGDLAGAEADYRRLIALDPDVLSYYFELERVLFEAERPMAAAELWADVHALRPDWTVAPRQRALALERAEEWDLLREELPSVLAIPDLAEDAHLHFLLGRALNDRRRHEDAIAPLRTAVAIAERTLPASRDNFTLYGNELAYTYRWAKRFDELRQWSGELRQKLGQ
jgi:tetratricopeptide (TPR) repeat protein